MRLRDGPKDTRMAGNLLEGENFPWNGGMSTNSLPTRIYALC